ncbi:MAG: nucleoside 2-deoxyribosyltransferase [Thaumarchaeota archaeon]|nr:nucleoside 2-deoxyribosyltransferase [Nitrososphaerota archaeon]
MRTVYLASPYGFSEQQRVGPLQELVKVLGEMGADVWEPFERNNQGDTLRPGAAYQIGQKDMHDVRDSDGILAVVNGVPPDEGVMIELGMAIAWGKEVFLFRDDFRRCTDSGEYPLNLMLFTGFPEKGWRDRYYTSIDELRRPDNALSKWLAS